MNPELKDKKDAIFKKTIACEDFYVNQKII